MTDLSQISSVADLAEALIACPSVTPAAGLVFDCLEGQLAPLGFAVHRFMSGEAPDGPVENLFAVRQGLKGSRHFAFAGHVDVVPPGEGWASAPFAPEVRGELLYGRGAVDMKGAIAAMVAAVREIPADAGTISFIITGVGILGVFGFAGFYSKDIILESAYASGPYGQLAFIVGATAALLTSFYSWRLIFLTFHGKARWDQSEHIQHTMHDMRDDGKDRHADHAHPSDGTLGYHPHESPPSMLIPLGVLALGAIFAGFLFHGPFVEAAEGAAFWAGSIAFDEHLMHAAHEVPLWVKLTPAIVMLIGLFIAWRNYIRDPGAPARIVASIPDLHRFLLNKWYFDELYDLIFVRPAQALGRFFWHRGDEQTIDRFGPNGAATAIAGGSVLTARLQSGFLYSYAFVMLLGLAALVTWAMAITS